jgi:3-oxoacyl-[acyl-carrier protein] reductase
MHEAGSFAAGRYHALVDLELADKTVLVTGASGGIGGALARTFAAEGARLVLHAGSRIEALRDWVREQAWHERAVCVRADVGRLEELEAAFAEGEAAFGRIDVCVANAGRWTNEPLLLHEAPVERIRSTIETNLLGSVWTARAFMAQLARHGPRPDGHGAALAFIGSTAGRFGERHHAEYAVSKAGLIGLMHSLKNEIALVDPYARVNVVEPGWTVTHMVRDEISRPGTICAVTRIMALRQLGRAVDVARTVVMLCSNASRHTSGQVVTVAGGMEGRTLWSDADIDEEAVRARLDL